MRVKSERARLLVLLGVFAVVAVVAGIRFWGDVSSAGGASRAGELDYTARDLPRLELDELDREADQVAEAARNPFIFGPPPTPTPNLTPRPTRPVVPTRPPRPTRTPRIALGADGQPKPPPPPFGREYIGSFGPEHLKVAAFRKRGADPDLNEIEVAVVGDVLEEIFIVREIGLESVLIGFVGYAPSEDTRVPLAEK